MPSPFQDYRGHALIVLHNPTMAGGKDALQILPKVQRLLQQGNVTDYIGINYIGLRSTIIEYQPLKQSPYSKRPSRAKNDGP